MVATGVPAAMEALLDCRQVSKSYPGVQALKQISLALYPGEIHALIGENGAGKSTLIKVIAGTEPPDPGAQIFFDGVLHEHLTPRQAIALGIAVIYQEPSLFEYATVAENIFLGPCMMGGRRFISWSKLTRQAAEFAHAAGVEPSLLQQKVGKLSRAKQQLVAIARALAMKARLLILDEPTASLSQTESLHLLEVLRKLRQSGCAMLFVSHKLDELFAICDRFTVLRDGQGMGCFSRDQLSHQKLVQLMVGA